MSLVAYRRRVSQVRKLRVERGLRSIALVQKITAGFRKSGVVTTRRKLIRIVAENSLLPSKEIVSRRFSGWAFDVGLS